MATFSQQGNLWPNIFDKIRQKDIWPATGLGVGGCPGFKCTWGQFGQAEHNTTHSCTFCYWNRPETTAWEWPLNVPPEVQKDLNHLTAKPEANWNAEWRLVRYLLSVQDYDRSGPECIIFYPSHFFSLGAFWSCYLNQQRVFCAMEITKFTGCITSAVESLSSSWPSSHILISPRFTTVHLELVHRDAGIA